MQPLSVGLVGLGPWGQRLAARWSAAPGLRWLGAADRRGAEAQLGLPSPLSLDALLAARPGLVLVATEPAAHEAVAQRCLATGAAVFIEKPPALTVRGLDALQRSAGGRGRLFGSAVWLDVPWVRAFRAALPIVGALRQLAFYRHNPSAPPRGLDELVDLAPHDLLLLHAILGRVADEVRAERGPAGVVARLEWRAPAPIQATLDLSWARPRRRRLVATGENGVLMADEAMSMGEGRGAEPGLALAPAGPDGLGPWEIVPWQDGPEPLLSEQARLLRWMSGEDTLAADEAWGQQRLGVVALEALRESLGERGRVTRPGPT